MQCNFLGREFGVAGVSRKLPFCFLVCVCVNSLRKDSNSKQSH